MCNFTVVKDQFFTINSFIIFINHKKSIMSFSLFMVNDISFAIYIPLIKPCKVNS